MNVAARLLCKTTDLCSPQSGHPLIGSFVPYSPLLSTTQIFFCSYQTNRKLQINHTLCVRGVFHLPNKNEFCSVGPVGQAHFAQTFSSQFQLRASWFPHFLPNSLRNVKEIQGWPQWHRNQGSMYCVCQLFHSHLVKHNLLRHPMCLIATPISQNMKTTDRWSE